MQNFSCSALLRCRLAFVRGFGYGDITLCVAPFQKLPLPFSSALSTVLQPRLLPRQRRFGLLRVRSPLLTQSLLFSFPPGNEMFQFPGFASRTTRDAGTAAGGLPHSEIRASMSICLSARLIAAYHVLRRLQEPRHPSCALFSFPFFLMMTLSFVLRARGLPIKGGNPLRRVYRFCFDLLVLTSFHTLVLSCRPRVLPPSRSFTCVSLP